MADDTIDFGDIYLASNVNSNSIDEKELYLLVVREPEETLREHGNIYLTMLEDGEMPIEKYCVEVFDGKFVNLKAEPTGAKEEHVRRLQLISRLSEHQKVFFKEILESMERRNPGRLKFYN
jgi:hypothetical protein